jgi:sensor histidine kinase YesM
MQLHRIILKYKLYHLLFWLLLFGAWYFFRYQDFSSNLLAAKITALKVIFLALVVYVTNYILIPQLLYKKKYTSFGVSYILFVFITSIAKMYLESMLMNNIHAFNLLQNFKGRVYDNVIPHFLLASTGAAFKLLYDYAKAQKRMGELAKEKADAELNFLKSQVNPHFLFNSINAVYFLIDKNNFAARDALHKFSGMLRYQLYECNGKKTTIEKEIDFLKAYIDMQSLRLNKNTVVDFTCNENVKGFSIEPLLLIPFVENAFKHLSHFSEGKKNEIRIDISNQNGEMRFTVMNSTEGKGNETPGGIGLANVERRLELLYPGKHTLDIKEEDEKFNVSLKLTVDD